MTDKEIEAMEARHKALWEAFRLDLDALRRGEDIGLWNEEDDAL